MSINPVDDVACLLIRVSSAIKQLVISKDEVVGLVLFALAYTFMLLFSVMGYV